MFKLRIFLSIIIFSFLLIFTSFIKNQSREIEKKINNISKIINIREKDLNETQLDFFYLTSPSILEQKIEHLDQKQYSIMEFSNIFLSMKNFLDLEKKLVLQKNNNGKKSQKK